MAGARLRREEGSVATLQACRDRLVGCSTVLHASFSAVNRAELRQRYREGQEDQLGALGLVVNMIVLWNTIYMEAVLEQFRREGYPVNEEDKARLSPLIHEHINTQGRQTGPLPHISQKSALRVSLECRG